MTLVPSCICRAVAWHSTRRLQSTRTSVPADYIIGRLNVEISHFTPKATRWSLVQYKEPPYRPVDNVACALRAAPLMYARDAYASESMYVQVLVPFLHVHGLFG